ncbi:carnitine O-acetyltransferase-like isoform X2 [Stegostoma tigrinum]|uniref:carnitine O-acetyltransferase-like isoform X2 n=1 Tax=Stegostoma tigrinum TaxID=3053191 RepID=UPI00202AD075|nr:carnitine O-acetyltransferase-like isoform X2 [Stegostoma tigrinum]
MMLTASTRLLMLPDLLSFSSNFCFCSSFRASTVLQMVRVWQPAFFIKSPGVWCTPGRPFSAYCPLPQLPIPPLKHTLERYLLALQPLVTPEELEQTREIVREFSRPHSIGSKLQDRLERRSRRTENWLMDWWLQNAYLECRLPLAVHSNPAVVLPKQNYNDWKGQLRKTLPTEYMRGKPLCMDLYPRILSSCRIPGPKHDTLINYGFTRSPPTHVTVVRNFQFFHLDVYNSDGSPLTVDQIHMQLQQIRNLSWKTDKEPLGVLTSDHRNTWGQAYNTLMKDKLNRESVRAIQKSIFTVCLDSPVLKISEEKYTSRMAAQMLHGGGSYSNSGNRWFDKTLQFIVGEDGSCGVIYEQSSAEGPPIATILDHVLDYCKDPDTVRTPMIPLPLPKKLYFYITPEIKRDIEHAKQNLDILVNDLDISCFTYRNFGKNFPKLHGISPDSFVQMALQLAYFRMYKELCATCESVSMRNFHLGRTDVIRSSSTDSLEFVISMDDPEKEINQKRAALGKAVDCHSAYTDMAIKGLAIDRHLLGLKLQAIEEGLSVPEIFMDTSFAVATHWRLSTGQVAARADCVMCFGPMVPDGYGVWYNPLEDHINFTVSAFNCCEETNAESFSKSLEIALSDMQNLVLQTSGQAA